ncbi:MAG: penicillin-binding protein 2 [Clostridium sp.]|nr:penicillin-binding protein 2 [Clostridium sp.]
MQKKLAITVLVIMLALIVLVGVLYNIVSTKGADYNEIVLNHQYYDSRAISHKRGNIMDRNGTILATDMRTYDLFLDPRAILNEEGSYFYEEATLAALQESLGYDIEDLREKIHDNPSARYLVYEREISTERKEAFETYQAEKNKEYKEKPASEGGKNRVGGVHFEQHYRRYYPYGDLACTVLGFVRKDREPSGGVEQYYNEVLTGVDGREYGYLNDESNPERTVKQPENGNSVVLTIDANIQGIVSKYIDNWQNTVGANMTAVIVMDPNNGEILAMDTSRRYDPNDPADLSRYYSQEQQDAMSSEEKTNARNTMWKNWCVSETYEPGSPQKAFTVAGGMEVGAITGNESYVCGGKLHVGDWDIRCVARSGHGTIDVTHGLMKSCNVVMMNIAMAEGREHFCDNQAIFGFGSKTGIDLLGEESGIIYKASNMDSSSLATNSFGQNFNCTAIQMASAYASLINGGSYYQPHVMKRIVNESGAVIKKNDPILVRETVSETTTAFIRNALFETVNGVGGTAGAAKVEGYDVAGKTGTAQKQPRSAKNYLVSFMGFAPAFDPQVLVYVVIDQPHLPGEEQAHSTFASNICAEVMREILPYMNVFPAGAEMAVSNEILSGMNEGIIENPAAENPPEEIVPGVTFDEEFLEGGDEDYIIPDEMPEETEAPAYED